MFDYRRNSDKIVLDIKIEKEVDLMNIWWLVIGLFVIAIILLLISVFTKDNTNNELEDRLDRLTEDQSQELFALKTRISELEHAVFNATNASQESYGEFDTVEEGNTYVAAEEEVEPVNVESIEDDVRESVINDYAQGYTMHEISNHVGISTNTVQAIIDDYIENR